MHGRYFFVRNLSWLPSASIVIIRMIYMEKGNTEMLIKVVLYLLLTAKNNSWLLLLIIIILLLTHINPSCEVFHSTS